MLLALSRPGDDSAAERVEQPLEPAAVVVDHGPRRLSVTGTILAALFTADIATSSWSAQQTAEFREAVTIAGLALTVVAAALVAWGIVYSSPRRRASATASPRRVTPSLR